MILNITETILILYCSKIKLYNFPFSKMKLRLLIGVIWLLNAHGSMVMVRDVLGTWHKALAAA